jgi:hypothetical protein
MNTKNNTFCIFPWIHQHITTNGDVLPCCTANYEFPLGNIRQNTIEEIWNDEEYRKLRKNMLNGIKSDHCKTCYLNEENADPSVISSFRKNANHEFKEFFNIVDLTKDDGSVDNLTLKYFDVRWSNICNFKCRTCNDGFSSSISQEIANSTQKDNPEYKIFIKASDNNDSLLEQFKPYLSEMKIIYFAGGEPLITEEHYKILDFLIEQKSFKPILRYNSNCSNFYYKKKNIIDYWKNFERIELMASIDSWGKRAEYIRHGTNWKTIVDNLTLIKKECPHVSITINSVIGIFNCLTVTEFLEELEEKELINIWQTSVFFYRQLYPEWQSFTVIPKQLRYEAVDKIEKYISKKFHYSTQSNVYSNLVVLREHLKLDDTQCNLDFIKSEINRLDKLRNESFQKTFPELDYLYK